MKKLNISFVKLNEIFIYRLHVLTHGFSPKNASERAEVVKAFEYDSFVLRCLEHRFKLNLSYAAWVSLLERYEVSWRLFLV